MPCYLFTWHAYATWMPDRRQGYVKKGRGILPPDRDEAARYRARQKESTAEFDELAQRIMIEEAMLTATMRRFNLHGIATDLTHLHLLMSWRDERAFEQLRRGTRESLCRRLNQHDRRRWLEQGGSRKRVRERQHFDYLMEKYLPQHAGWKWREDRGLYK